MSSPDFEKLIAIMQRRKTTKVIGNPERPVPVTYDYVPDFLDKLTQAIAAAGMAPFHFARNADGIAEPWRVHILPAPSCRNLAAAMVRLIDLPPQNRLPGLLSGCGAMVLVNWLPVSEMDDAVKQDQINREHLCAAAAMTQSLLLLLESLEFPNYWASGGLLVDPRIKAYLGIPFTEETAAAVFVGFPHTKDVEFLDGKNRAVRNDASKWSRQILPADLLDVAK